MFEEIKTCSKCKQDKPVSEFPFKQAPKLQSYCKACQSLYGKSHYERNKSTYFERNKRYQAEIKSQIDLLKEVPCADCRQIFPSICMDFDHIYGDKINDVSQLRYSNSLKKILQEIEKCEVVCACCHRIRTSNRLNSKRAARIELA